MNLKKQCIIYSFGLLLLFKIAAIDNVEIQKGDTLYSIAKKYNIPVNTLLEYNQITDPAKVKIGTIIKLPQTYTILKGDTLYKIAKLYNVTVDAICKYNKIDDITNVPVGTILTIPSGDIKISKQEEVLWPHPGTRKELVGFIKGVEIEGAPGDFVISVAHGKVKWADPYRGRGKVIMVQEENGYIYIYWGNQELLVTYGEEVYPNTKLAKLSKNAEDGKAKVFFSISKDGIDQNPEFRPKNN